MKSSVYFLLLMGHLALSQDFSGRPTLISDSFSDRLEILSFTGPVRVLEQKKNYVRFSLGNPYHLPGLYAHSLDLIKGFRKFSLSINAKGLGTEFYSQQKFSLGIANRFDWGLLGISLNRNYLWVENFPTKNQLSFDWGGVFQLNETIFYETSIRNINFWDAETGKGLTFSTGIWTRVSDQLTLSGTFLRELGLGNSFRFYMDFNPGKHLELFIGMDPINALASGGIKFNPGNWSLSYFQLFRQNLRTSSRWEVEWWF